MTPSLASRLSGAVWGHLVGDALGVPYEFTPPSRIGQVVWGHRGTHNQPPGTWSDDGGLMLALLDSLLSVGFDLNDQARRFLAWRDDIDYKPGPLFDIGGTTDASLARLRSGTRPHEAGGSAERDNGNGSLMRILPVALVGRSLPESELVEWACRSSKITHAHPRSQIACAIYCLMVGSLLGGMEPEPALEHSLDAARQALPAGHADELIELRRYRQRSGGGYVLDCLWSAVDAFQSSSDYRTTVVRAIEFGNDTDTTAAVAGGLAGAHWGVPSIPQEWIQRMRGGEIVIPLIERLTAGLGA